ncbi:MAG: hypothetical protein NTU54_00095 [Candidatus Omnitrophica bacterium]|nr:hypothetical protein [Candidatus Omnitrophota bacterium]
MSAYPAFKRTGLYLKTLSLRQHDLGLDVIKGLNRKVDKRLSKRFIEVAGHIVRAKGRKKAVILMIGGHVLRSGVQKFVIDLMRRGYISCIAMNGAGVIHDFEFALIGATTENVAKYISLGEFGLWKETGRINDYINNGHKRGLGLGEAVGKAISEGDFLYKDISLLAEGWRLRIPITIHVGIGYDIIHEHPNCDGAATGAASYRDFLIFTKILERLEGGVVMNFGSAVMAPEVFLKSLSMVRNVSRQRGKSVKHFTTLVCDLYDLPKDFSSVPDNENQLYYFRPWKTMLVRTVADGGKAFYVKGDHSMTIPALWDAVNGIDKYKKQSR